LLIVSVLGPGRGDGPACPGASVVEVLLLLGGLQDLEGAHEGLVDAHEGARVVELAAVVGGGEERDQLALGEELVAVLDDLVRPADEVDVVLLVEALHDLLSEGEGHAPVVLAPALHVLVGVRPEQVAEQARVGHVRGPHDPLDLLQGVQLGGEAAVHAQDLLVDQGRHWQAVEAVSERLPNSNVVPPLALVVEPVDSVDGRALVVAPQQEEVLGVFDLVGQQQTDRFQRLLASIDVVSQEQVIRIWGEASVLEQSEQVEELAVDVSYRKC